MTSVRTWIIKNILNKMENKEPLPITTTEKKNKTKRSRKNCSRKKACRI